jgi:hypothetical protein
MYCKIELVVDECTQLRFSPEGHLFSKWPLVYIAWSIECFIDLKFSSSFGLQDFHFSSKTVHPRHSKILIHFEIFLSVKI